MLLTTNFEMTERRRRRRPKVVPRAAADFVRQLKISHLKGFIDMYIYMLENNDDKNQHFQFGFMVKLAIISAFYSVGM